MKIAVIGLGYVGLSNAVLLAQQNEVVAVDVTQSRVDDVNNKRSPIVDAELEEYLATKELNLVATTDASVAYEGADFVVPRIIPGIAKNIAQYRYLASTRPLEPPLWFPRIIPGNILNFMPKILLPLNIDAI